MVSERRIRELCARAVAARDTEEIVPVLSELRNALHQHAEQLRTMLDQYPLAPVRSLFVPSARAKTDTDKDTNSHPRP